MSVIDKNQFETLTRIIQSAALEDSAEGQIDYILVNLSKALSVDVCTLYRTLDDNSLSLVATHGLVKTHPVIIPAGRGLVGKVVATQHSLNLVEPSNFSEYYHIDESNEEQLHSFCGVPIFSRGTVSGVLVVQSFQARALDNNQEALLATLAIHLGLLLESLEFGEHPGATMNLVRRGISGSPGLAIGRAFVMTAASLFDTVQGTVEDTAQTVADWEALKARAKKAFRDERDVLREELGENLSSLLDAYAMMLDDPAFDTQVSGEISKGSSLPWALKKTVGHLSEMFKAIDDPYLRARHEDVELLGENLYQLWRNHQEEIIEYPDEPIILLGRSISVSTIAKLLSKNLAAIVCTEGAALSHIAVFANALGIPAVMGIGDITFTADRPLIVDGDNGRVIANPDDTTLDEYRKLIADITLLSAELLKNADKIAVTRDGHRIILMANSGLNADVAPGLRFGAEGIGLYRTELPFMVRNSLPSESDQYAIYKGVLSHYSGKPVYFRTLDIGSDKPLPYLPVMDEENPALGLRGIRYTLDNLTMLSTQLRAILRASETFDKLHLVFPMVSTTEQLDHCLDLLEATLSELRAEGLRISRPQVGIMLEVPSCISLLPMWSGKIDFVSIGTNDLTQYLLAVDRNNALVSKHFDHFHPAVLHELMRIVEICRQINLGFSVCGELASLPLATVFLVGMGCSKLSLSAAKIPLIKELICNIRQEDATAVLERALLQDNASSIRAISARFLLDLHLPFENLLFESR